MSEKPEIIRDWAEVAALSPEAKAQLAYELSVRHPPHTRAGKVLAVKRSKERLEAMMGGMPAWEPRGAGGLKREEILAGEATPQTLDKLKHDVAGRLINRGVIERGHWVAVEEMRELAESYRTSGGSNWSVERVQGGRWSGPLERRRASVDRHYRQHFLPWLAWLADEPIIQETATKRIVYLCAPALVRMVIVDNMAMSAAEARCRIVRSKGLGSCVLRIALDRYMAIVAGEAYDQTAEKQAFSKAA